MNQLNNSIGSSPNMFGEKLYQKRARAAFPLLIECVSPDRTLITYGQLAEKLNRLPLHLGTVLPVRLGNALGSISTTLYELEQYWGEDIPRLTNIVVTQNYKPGRWICEQITGAPNVSPTDEELKKYVFDPIFDYPKWDAVRNTVPTEEDLKYYRQELFIPTVNYPGYRAARKTNEDWRETTGLSHPQT